MTNLLRRQQDLTEWRTRAYVFGVLAGVIFGLLAAYMYIRAGEEEVTRTGEPARVQTGELLGLGLAMLAIIRQVAEMGKPERKPNRR